MKLEEVPAGCFAIRCNACGDCLAIPIEATLLDKAQAVADHEILCKARRR